jgi:hypothetical protein
VAFFMYKSRLNCALKKVDNQNRINSQLFCLK